MSLASRRRAMNVVCTIDDGYAQHCGTMLASLFVNNPEVAFRVFVVTDGLSTGSRTKLDVVARRFGQQLECRTISTRPLAGARVSDHVSIATYFRILIPSFVPDDVDQILFLDCDTIVRGSVAELYETPIDGCTHAAVPNPFSRDDVTRLGMPDGATYFNAGVLLMNLQLWRKERVSEQVLAYVNANTERLRWWDQDALNATLHARWRRCPPKWNAQSMFYRPGSPAELGVTVSELDEARVLPRIVHFTGTGKPWTSFDEHPFENDYFVYLALTPWKDAPRPVRPSLKSRLAQRLRAHIGVWR